ncbi:MAG: hypothetical protein FWD05_13235, partial [Oscillospiraceae bacterium]|nr:hypothetical protein [Oscillospiraceae bacterium]
MKKSLSIFLIMLLIVAIVGCGAQPYHDTPVYTKQVPESIPEPVETVEADEPCEIEISTEEEFEQFSQNRCFDPTISDEASSEVSSSLPLDIIADYFAQMCAVFTQDGGELWGTCLHTPFIFVDPLTRHAVANQSFPEGQFVRHGNIYVGTLSDNIHIGHTALEFRGEWWGMMLWDSWIQSDEIRDRVLHIMVHEAFHARQLDGLVEGRAHGQSPDFFDYHMETHIYIQLEMAALLVALHSATEEEKLQAINDALSIRESRRQRNLGMDIQDIELVIQEGTAQYTEYMLSIDCRELRLSKLEILIEEAALTTNIRGASAYIFGPLYGFLLDEIGVDWKTGIGFTTDLGLLLKDAVGIVELIAIEELDLEPYGYSEIIAREQIRAEEISKLIEEIELAFYNQPRLTINIMGEFYGVLDGIRVPKLGHFAWVFYGDIEFSGVFGQLTICDGYLLLEGGGQVIPVPGIEINENR